MRLVDWKLDMPWVLALALKMEWMTAVLKVHLMAAPLVDYLDCSMADWKVEKKASMTVGCSVDRLERCLDQRLVEMLGMRLENW